MDHGFRPAVMAAADVQPRQMRGHGLARDSKRDRDLLVGLADSDQAEDIVLARRVVEGDRGQPNSGSPPPEGVRIVQLDDFSR